MQQPNDRPRLLITGKAYDPHIGGIETVMQQTAEYMRRYAKTKVLCCRDTIGLTRKDKIGGVPVTYAGSFGTIASCPMSLSYIGTFRRKVMTADTVELHLPFPLADLALLLSGYRGRVVVAWHSDVVRQKLILPLYQPLMKWLLKRADAILVATQAHIDSSPYLKPFREKCVIVPYGIDPAVYADRPHQQPLTGMLHDKTAKKILFTGRLVYYKGADVLLEAFSRLQGNAELFLAGTGVLEPELRERAKALGAEHRVHFLGRRMTSDLRDMFADCDFFVLPSVANSEAFGIVQLEAMVYGKPVINTALPTGVPLVSPDGVTGLTVPPSDPDALAAAMDRLIADDALREQYGKAARTRVLQEYSLQKVMEQTRKVLLPDGYRLGSNFQQKKRR
ncbi:MAG: glycosyltransferase [Oscillospiraceae bacterium]|nr:glycosyltransferase [Oscillospiraceae bacterium]